MRYLSDQNENATGHLRNIGLPRIREQLRNVMKALQPDEYENRATQATQRRKYQVPFINAL
jgi:hypothetical protein